MENQNKKDSTWNELKKLTALNDKKLLNLIAKAMNSSPKGFKNKLITHLENMIGIENAELQSKEIEEKYRLESEAEFNDKRIDKEIISLNKRLIKFLNLNKNKEIKKLLTDYFKNYDPKKRRRGLEAFNLERWSGGESESNPTLDIVLIKDRFKFNLSRYGGMYSLKTEDFKNENVKTVIENFFKNPLKYFARK